MTDSSNDTVHDQDLFVGSALAIGGNLLISISLNLQKFTHNRNQAREESIHYTRDPLWWLGLILMGLGEVGNFTAYGFAPASLVAPLGTTTVVANLFLAAVFLKEKIRPEHLFGCALAIIGAFLLVTFSSRKEKVLSGDEIVAALTQISFLVYIVIELVAIIVLLVLLYRFQMKLVVIYLLITSITASFTVISAKAVSSMLNLSVGGTSQFAQPIFYIMLVVMVATAVVQVKYLNQAMKNFDSTVVVPTNFVFFTVSAIVAGIIFYKEFWGMNALEICMFLFGCILCFIGVYFVTVKRPEPDKDKVLAPPSQVAPELFPSWLLASVNVGQVQPTGAATHGSSMDQDCTPILTAKEGDMSSSQESLVGHENSAITLDTQDNKNYGATENNNNNNNNNDNNNN
ncbi:NIPA-like protein 2 isoform X1 [Haliotis rufescens]|uniref:NIPA-like protein 2 isoform X1 n=1 Tax=Haliotis rufescens TaxID=6454 RepID=UPI001EAF9534|nr:NIPA-like protein 2 isoform X1 [Haliotis rufescens]